MDERIRLKEQLRFYLERGMMTAAELARKTGVPKQSLSDWLSGAQPRKLLHLKRVADLLGVSVDHLCFGEHPTDSGKASRKQEVTTCEWVEGVFEVKGQIRKVK
ncbi:MAG: helix-turn-helix transcriptional regulator [Deltaproteobacteria bacterium]|nr:helix-turn-helix transcriptional regulator [Deltaproteobacteria bacterium]